MAPKVQATTEKNKINFITINNIYVVHNTIKKVKIQPIEWKKIFRI